MTRHETPPVIEETEDSAVATTERGADVYLLGGSDYEMQRIATRLGRAGIEFIDKDVSWEGASIQAYKDEVASLLAEGKTPVAIELKGAEDVSGVVDIDHHNDKSHRPASITQVLERANLPSSLADKLAAGNDARYYRGMEEVVANKLDHLAGRLDQMGVDEVTKRERLAGAERWLKGTMIDRVRQKDREAQGVTAEMEAEAEKALAEAEYTEHGIMVVTLEGDRPSPVTDRLNYHEWPDGQQKLVVICNADKTEKEVWFFGDGDIAKNARDHFVAKKEARLADGPTPNSNEYHAWGGGSGYGKKGESAFCGIVAGNPAEAIDYLDNLHN